jgi:hypothetical protein
LRHSRLIAGYGLPDFSSNSSNRASASASEAAVEDPPQVVGGLIPIPARREPERVADQVDDAGLNDGELPHRKIASGPLRPSQTAMQTSWTLSTGSACATNPIESTFDTVRLRTRVTKRPGSRIAGAAMAFKLIESAQTRWRGVSAPHLVPLVRARATFINVQLVERPNDQDQQKAARQAA